MSIPEEIRNITRPKNTIIKLIGDKYAVIEQVGCTKMSKIFLLMVQLLTYN